MARDRITFTVEGGLELSEFLVVMRCLAALVQALSAEIAPETPIHWRIEHLQGSCAGVRDTPESGLTEDTE